MPEPVVYGVQGALREYYGAKEGPPIASTLDHIVAAVAGRMYGTLRGALAGRKIEFDRDGYKASVEGRIVGIGKTIRIASIHVHYDLAVPADAREATERALAAASSRLSRPSERQGRHRHHLGGHAPSRGGGR